MSLSEKIPQYVKNVPLNVEALRVVNYACVCGNNIGRLLRRNQTLRLRAGNVSCARTARELRHEHRVCARKCRMEPWPSNTREHTHA